MNADRNLLFGLLALQNNFINRHQLLTAFGTWSLNHQQSIADLLVSQQALNTDTRDLLNRLVDQHIQMSGDESQSLSSLSVDPQLCSEMSMMADTFILSSVDKLTKPTPEDPTLPDLDRAKGERFLVVRPLDRGGLGIVSVAFDRQLNREVALKEIRFDRADDDRLRQKFVLEAEVTGGLEHPGIVPVYALGQADDGRPYYAMRLIRGDNLRRYIQKFHQGVRNGNHTFDSQELRRLLRRFLDVCEAISYAHARGVLHRDLKPSNIMLGPYGETLVVDWGLAKAMGVSGETDEKEPANDRTVAAPSESPLLPSSSTDDDAATIHGSIVGTPSYASPEQLSGNTADVTTLSDVYGLGAILYEILTAQPPASGTLEEVIKDVTQGNIPACRSVEATVPKPLEAICHKALATKPKERFASARLLASEIERWLDDAPIETLPEPLLVRVRRWARNHPRTVSASTATAAMILVGLFAFSSLVQRNNRQLVELNRQLDTANRSLDMSNSKLVSTNEALTAAKNIAEQQSQLSLATLNAVVADIQSGLRSVPGSARIRRKILSTSLAKLEQVATEVVGKASVDRSTMLALGELGETISRFGTDEQETSNDRIPPSRLARTLLERSLQIAQTLYGEDKETTQTIEDLATAHDRVGLLVLMTGDTPLAEHHFQQGLNYRQALVQAVPDSWSNQRLLSISLLRLGDAWLKLGKSSEAAELFQSAADIRKQRTISHPSDQQARRDYATALEKVSSAATLLAEPESAIDPLATSLTIREQLLKEAPDDPSLQREVFIASGLLADLHRSLGNTDQAITFCQRAYELSKALHDAAPDDLQGFHDLASSLDRLSRTHFTKGQTQEGIKALEDSLSYRRALLEKDPGNPFYSRELTLTLESLGDVLRKQGRLTDALSLYNESLDIVVMLTQQDPKNVNKKRDLAISYLEMGDIHLASNSPERALENYERCKEIVDALLVEEPENLQYHKVALVTLSKLGNAQKALGNFKESLQYLQSGLRQEEAKLSATPENLKIRWNIALWHELIGDVLTKMEDHEQALLSFQQSVLLRGELAKENPNDKTLQLDLITAEANKARALLALGREEQAIETLKLSTEINEQLVASNSEDLELHDMLAYNYRFLAASHYALEQFEEAETARRSALAASQKLTETTQQNDDWNQNHINDLIALADYQAQKSDWSSAIDFIKRAIAFVEILPTTPENSPWRTDVSNSLQEQLNNYQSQLP